MAGQKLEQVEKIDKIPTRVELGIEEKEVGRHRIQAIRDSLLKKGVPVAPLDGVTVAEDSG